MANRNMQKTTRDTSALELSGKGWTFVCENGKDSTINEYFWMLLQVYAIITMCLHFIPAEFFYSLTTILINPGFSNMSRTATVLNFFVL